MQVSLISVIRDASGKIHRPGETAEVVKRGRNLDRELIYARFPDQTTAVIFADEIEEVRA